jgi:hypothetical protein
MRGIATSLAISLLFATAAAADTSSPLSFAQLIDFCGSDTLAGAEAKADRLGWRRLAEAELKDWRTGFVAHNGGAVEVSGWQQGEEGGDALSFWVVRGADQHRACSYTVNRPSRLLDELTERFGPPQNLDKQEFGLTASWKLGAMEISYSQVGNSAVLYVVHSD